MDGWVWPNMGGYEWMWVNMDGYGWVCVELCGLWSMPLDTSGFE